MPQKETLEKLMNIYKIDEIAQQYNVHKRTISRWIDHHQLSYENIRLQKYPSDLNELQKDFIIGSLLGDGSIKKDGCYSFSQKILNKSYVDYVYEIMQPFTTRYTQETWKKPIKQNGIIIRRSEDTCLGFKVETIIHPIFKKLRNEWYPNGVKAIPHIKLNPYILSIWYADDGTNRTSGSKDIRLNTQCFSIKENEKLLQLIKETFNIIGKISIDAKKPLIRIGAKYYFDFIDIVKSNIIKFGCFDYKINIVNAPCNIKITSIEDKNKIIALRNDYTQMQLAKMFNISQSTISNILIKTKINEG